MLWRHGEGFSYIPGQSWKAACSKEVTFALSLDYASDNNF